MRSKLIRIGLISLALKVVLLLLMVYGMFSGGIARVSRLWLGVEVIPLNDTLRTHFQVTSRGGVLVNEVMEQSPAQRAGLQRGDVIVNCDARPIFNANDIQVVLKTRRANDPIEIVFLRDGTTYATKAILDYKPLHASALEGPSLYNYRLTLLDASGLFVMGIVAGTLSGMLGCGGGVLKVSLLIVVFGFEIFLAKVVALITSCFMSISASFKYIKFKRVDKEALKYLIPSALAGSLIGAVLSVMLRRHVLEIFLGVFLVYTALDIFYQLYISMTSAKARDQEDDPVYIPDPTLDRSVLIFAGLPMGIASSMLGITGGVIGSPMQGYLVKFPIKTCIANTVVCAIFVSLLGGLLLLTEGLMKDYFSLATFLRVAVCVIPGSMIGGQIGTFLTHKLPTNHVKAAYALVVLFIAYKVLF